MCISINLTEKLLNMLIFTIATMCLLIISDLKTMIESSANKSDIINKFVSIMNNDYNGTTGGNFIFSIMSVSSGNTDATTWDSVGFKFIDDLINNKLCKF